MYSSVCTEINYRNLSATSLRGPLLGLSAADQVLHAVTRCCTLWLCVVRGVEVLHALTRCCMLWLCAARGVEVLNAVTTFCTLWRSTTHGD